MTLRLIGTLTLLTCTAVVGCSDPISNGNDCFETGECGSGVCTETVYGQFCMNVCSPEVIICDGQQACLQSDALSGEGGSSGEDDLWVCLPGAERLQSNSIEAVEVLGVCTYSLDCVLGAICVCIEGQSCDLDDPNRGGPICVQICEPDVTECPLRQDCVVLDDGRAFCDPTTSTPI